MVSASGEWLAGRLVIELGGRIAVGVCGTLLAQAATREANVRAYNDASLLNSLIAFCFLFWTFASDIFRVLTGGIEKARRLTRRRLSVARYRQSRKLRTTPQ